MSRLMLEFPKPYADAVARLRAPGGLALAAAFAWFARPSIASLQWGLPVALAGLALRAWAAGSLHKDRELATWGPYACTRNPLYLGTLLAAAGFAIAARSAWLGALFAAMFGLVYLPAIQLEQQHLADLFAEHPAYAKSVPLIWPRWRVRPGKGGRFRWSQYAKNREYEAAIAFAAGAAWLVWRAVAVR